MDKGKKVIISLIVILSIGVVGILGYVAFDMFWAEKETGPFMEGVKEKYGLTFHNLHHVIFPWEEPDLPQNRRPTVLEDVGSGIWVHGDKFLYPVPLNPNYEIKNIDFNAWKAVNQDIIGYLEFETLDVISYPVFFQDGTDFYLKHNRTGAYDIYGELYVEGKIKYGHSRTNTIIYGHNMRNGTMFGSLRKYKEASYLAGNEFFWYYTPNGKYRYQIFSVYETLYTSDTFTWFEAPGAEYTAWLDKMNNQSKYETGIRANPNDEVITLCTCTSAGGDYRLVLQARMVYKDES